MQNRHGKKGSKFSRDQGRKAKGYLPEDTLRYYRHVSDALSEGFESEELKNVFLNNAFKQLSEEIVQVAQNQTVSRIIETLASHAKPSHLRKLFVALTADLSVAFLDRFASHVFQTLIQLLPVYYGTLPTSDNGGRVKQKSDVDDDDDDDDDSDESGDLEYVQEAFQAVCGFVDENFETVLTHTYGSHVMRAMLETLSGVKVSHEVKKGHGGRENHHSVVGTDTSKLSSNQKLKLPAEFRACFDKYAARIFQVCDYEVHLKDSSFSPLLQTVLLIWHRTNPSQCQSQCQTIVQRMMETCPQSDDPVASVPDMAQNQVGSYLLEVVFRLSSADLLQEVFTTLLKGRLLYFSIHPVANFVLQKFISHLKDKELMQEVSEEMFKNIEDILAVGHLGLVTCLADACRRLHLKQEEFVMTLMEAFHCKEPETRQAAFPKLVASFTAYEVFFKIDEETGKPAENAEEPTLSGPVNMHGSLLLQQLLQFDKPKFVAPAIAAMKPAEVCMMCCDPAGSHIMDVFFSSLTVLEKNKDILLKKLKGLLMEVACTKNGSRCLENIWKSLNVKQRTRIAEELAQSEARLRSDRFGHFLYHNLALSQFIHKRQLWLEQQGAQSKRKRMMAELLHGKEIPAKKKKMDEEDVSDLLIEEEEDQVTALFTKHRKQRPELDTKAQVKQDVSQEESDSGVQLEGIVDRAVKKKKKSHSKDKKVFSQKQDITKQDSGTEEEEMESSDSVKVRKKQKALDTKKAKKRKSQLSRDEVSLKSVEPETHTGKKKVKRKRKDESV